MVSFSNHHQVRRREENHANRNCNRNLPCAAMQFGGARYSQFLDEMGDYVEMFEPAFRRPEQLEWSKNYLQGLAGRCAAQER